MKNRHNIDNDNGNGEAITAANNFHDSNDEKYLSCLVGNL